MVNLALLCNLYADGPTTLGRLRELGCETLEAVEQLQRADLEWALQAGATACERFRREARLLREREGATRTSSTQLAVNSQRPASTDRVEASAESGTKGGTGSDSTAGTLGSIAAAATPPAPTRNAPRDSSILGVLLQAWRRASGRGTTNEAPHQTHGGEFGERGFERPVAAPERGDGTGADDSMGANGPDHLETVELPPRPRATAFAAHETGDPIDERVGTGAIAVERRTEHGTPLDRIRFQGVEADYAEQIAHLGIRTVEDFLAAQPLDLAGRSTMRYTVLLRMQFLARRELERVAHG